MRKLFFSVLIFSVLPSLLNAQSDVRKMLKDINGDVDEIIIKSEGQEYTFSGDEAAKLFSVMKGNKKKSHFEFFNDDRELINIDSLHKNIIIKKLGSDLDDDDMDVLVFINEDDGTSDAILNNIKKKVIVTEDAGKKVVRVTIDEDGKENIEIYEAEESEIKKISFQKTPQSVIAVCNIIENKLDISEIEQNLTLALDNVQDPGNVGTIIRIADWFGIKNILASYSTADIYNPKVIQATMGAFARMKVHYVLLPELLRKLKNDNNLIIYGTTLNGNNIYEQKLESKGIIVMGSEGNGISKPVLEILSEQLLIPNFSNNLQKSESLNVATATAIACSEFRRQQNY